MAHIQQFFFINAVKQFLTPYFKNKNVLEIGSLNINGTVRDFFEDCEYLGIDVGEGKDVDLICPGEDYGGQADSIDVVISCEAMEHNPGWRETWLNMIRLVKSDGLVIMTCATEGRRQHGTPEMQPCDSPLTIGKGQFFYQNLIAEDFTNLLNLDSWFSTWHFYKDCECHDLYFFGVRHRATPEIVAASLKLKNALVGHYYKKNIQGVY